MFLLALIKKKKIIYLCDCWSFLNNVVGSISPFKEKSILHGKFLHGKIDLRNQLPLPTTLKRPRKNVCTLPNNHYYM